MIVLKEFNLENVSVHFKWNNDPKLSYEDSDYPFHPESFETFLRRIKSVVSEENTRADLLEIHLAETDELVGIVDLYSIDTYNSRCCINCTIGAKEYIGSKYELEAIDRALHYCFDQLGMHKVTMMVFDFNTKKINYIQRAGLKKEGKLRKHVLKQDTFCDKLIFSILKAEHENPRPVHPPTVASAHS